MCKYINLHHDDVGALVTFFFFFCLPKLWLLVLARARIFSQPRPDSIRLLSSNGDFDLDTGVDVDNDLLDDLGGSIEATFVSLATQKKREVCRVKKKREKGRAIKV